MSNIQTAKKQGLLKILTSDSYKEQLAMALPSILPTEKFVRTVITCLNNNPKLAECTQESFFGSVIKLAQCGMEADGYNAHIVPYGKRATPIIDYKGLIEMMYRSGQVSAVNGYVVKANDEFEWTPGDKPKHSVKGGNRGETSAVYTIVTMKDGTQSTEVMFKDEIDAIRGRSPSGNNGPWKTDYDEMAKKTCLKRHSKWAPIASEAKDLLLKEVEAQVASEKAPSLSVSDFAPAAEEPKDVKATVVDDEVSRAVDDLDNSFEQATGQK